MDGNDDYDDGNPGGQNWELARLVGRYETFTKGVDRRLDKIENHLENGTRTISEIKNTMAKKSEQVDNIEERLKEVEDNGGNISRRRRLQMDGTTIAAVALALKEIITSIIGVFQ